MFFFRLRNLKREDENRKKKQVEQTYHFNRQRRGAKVFRTTSESSEIDQVTAPSRLFERVSPLDNSGSLDELDKVALQIPKWVDFHC